MHSARRRKGDGSGVNHVAASLRCILCAICFTASGSRCSIGHPARRGETTLRVPIEENGVRQGALNPTVERDRFFTVLAFSDSLSSF